MLVTVGGLMATLVFPGRMASTLAITATLSAAAAIRRKLRDRRSSQSNDTVAVNECIEITDESIVVEWSSVTCLLSAKKKNDDSSPRSLLQNASGIARPGRVVAILGPSGSGKSTLLNSLSGRLQASPSISLHGNVTFNGNPLDRSKLPIAYVTQEDLFFTQLTVRETLDLAVRLRLPKDMTVEQRNEFIDQLIRRLGLVSAADSRVGDEKTRGISGGEKKRLSLGVELISTPKLILCDEPTSGLDSIQAERVMNTLRSLALAGHTVICSIHQPSSSIFALCDDIVLLANGKQVYSGPADKAQDHFTGIGFPPPKNQFNPAEWYLQLISVDYTSDETTTESHARIDKLAAACPSISTSTDSGGKKTGNSYVTSGNVNESTGASSETAVVVSSVNEHGCKRGPFSQIRVLFSRAWKQTTRDKKTNVSRFMSSFMSALLFGGIYWKLGFSQRTIQDRLGLLQVCSINAAMSSLVKTLNVFPREGVLVNRERVRGTYNVFEYLSSKIFAELPVGAFFPLIFSFTVYPMARLSGGFNRILRFLGIITLESFTSASYGLAVGALVPSTEAALAVGPSTFVLQVVFGGLYITDKSVPRWAAWVPKVSIIKHAFEALCVNELKGLKFETESEYDVKTGDQVLQRLSWADSKVTKSCISQARILAFNYLFTYTILSLKKPRFEKLKPALDDDVVIEDVTNTTTKQDPYTPNGHVLES